jgi:hypothetical protein
MEENEENWQATALSKGRAGQGRTGQGGGFAGSESAVTVRGQSAEREPEYKV